jgi:hypothetical protein
MWRQYIIPGINVSMYLPRRDANRREKLPTISTVLPSSGSVPGSSVMVIHGDCKWRDFFEHFNDACRTWLSARLLSGVNPVVLACPNRCDDFLSLPACVRPSHTSLRLNVRQCDTACVSFDPNDSRVTAFAARIFAKQLSIRASLARFPRPDAALTCPIADVGSYRKAFIPLCGQFTLRY